jgi:DNA-binding MarR family transcriptional regulator
MIADLERAVHRVAVYLEHAAGKVGVTQAEAHVLAQLHRGGFQTVGALQREFGHKPSTLTSVLDRLEARGLIERRLNPVDRRSFLVALSGGGRRAARRVVAVLDDLERSVADNVSERDLAGLRAVAAALDQTVGDAQPLLRSPLTDSSR